MDEDVLRRAKDLAARHLGRRMRSEREVGGHLAKKGFEPDVIVRVLEDFRRVGLVDDRALVLEWTERELPRAPAGRRAVEARLRARGVAPGVLGEVLDGIFSREAETELGRKAAERYAPRLKRLPEGARKQRLYRFLMARGFSAETAADLVAETDLGGPVG
jgi:regulatory protein